MFILQNLFLLSVVFAIIRLLSGDVFFVFVDLVFCERATSSPLSFFFYSPPFFFCPLVFAVFSVLKLICL